MRCPNQKCGEWNFAASDKDSEQEVVRLSDAKISIVPRLPTLHPEMDLFFGGGGIVQTSTMLLGAEPGFGKDLALDTPIVTPTGWTTMGEVQVGDTVFDKDGVPCTVTFKSEVMHNSCFSVGFDGNEHIVAGQDHEWLTLTRRERMRIFKATPEFRAHVRATRKSHIPNPSRISWNAGKELPIAPLPVPSKRTTKQIAESLYVGTDGRANHAIDIAGELQLPRVDIPVDPYLLGLWLGDGFSQSSRIGMMETDFREILQHISWPIKSETILQRGGRTKPYLSVCFTRLATTLRTLGIFGNKRIPPIYLRASVEQRRELLRGLLDTDGTCSKYGFIAIDLSKRDLLEDVAELVHSLGIKATVGGIRKIIRGEDSHRLSFTAPFPCFKLTRKLVRQRFSTRSTTRSYYIVSAESVPTVPTACITVDSPSHTYLAGRSMIPTHNSTLVLQLADCLITHFIKVSGEKRNVVLVANEQSPDEIRAKAIELGIVHMHEICVVKAMGGFSGNLFEIISRYKPCFTVIDSLSKLVGRDPDLAVIVAAMMKELSVKLNMPTFMINQVTKDLNHAGQEKLQHEVDMTALGSTLGNKRILESEKNRNGQAPLALGMEMKGPEEFAAGRGGLTILGMVAPQDESEGEDEEPDDEPVNRLGEDGTEPGPRRLKK